MILARKLEEPSDAVKFVLALKHGVVVRREGVCRAVGPLVERWGETRDGGRLERSTVGILTEVLGLEVLMCGRDVSVRRKGLVQAGADNGTLDELSELGVLSSERLVVGELLTAVANPHGCT